MTPMYRRLCVLWCISALFFLVACEQSDSTSSQPTDTDNQAAVQTVKDFVAAIEEKNISKVLDLIDPQVGKKSMSSELRTYVDMLEKIERKNDTYTLEDNDGTKAHVRFSATISYAVRGAALQVQDVTSVFEVVKIDGKWYVRTIRPVVKGENDAATP